MRTALKLNDSKLALQKLSGLTITKILETRDIWFDIEFERNQAVREVSWLEEAIPSEKNPWKDSPMTPEQKSNVIAAFIEKIDRLTVELSQTVYLPMLLELRRENEEELTDTLQLMVIDVVKWHKTSEVMTTEQIFQTAWMIMDTFRGLTLEDIALCFYQAKNAKFGEVYNRVDGSVIINWLHAYKDKMQAIGMEQELTKHLQSKGTMYKEGGQYRISEMKAKGIDFNPSLNLTPIKKLQDLM